MAERRTLIEGIKRPTVDPQREQEFIYGGKPANSAESPVAPAAASTATTAAPITKAPLSTRIRADYAAALKRASLQRQIDGIEPSTINDMLEQALEPWLKGNGYLP
jgi:hypothetical protein